MSIKKCVTHQTGGGLEPLAISIPQTSEITQGEFRGSQVYERISRGEYEAVKSGSRTLVIFESVKRHLASLPRVQSKRQPRAVGAQST